MTKLKLCQTFADSVKGECKGSDGSMDFSSGKLVSWLE